MLGSDFPFLCSREDFLPFSFLSGSRKEPARFNLTYVGKGANVPI